MNIQDWFTLELTGLISVQSKGLSRDFSSTWKSKVIVCVHACVQSHFTSVMSDSVTPSTTTHQVPLSMGFSRQEYWSELPCPPPGDLSKPRSEPQVSYVSCIGRWVLYLWRHLGTPGYCTHASKNIFYIYVLTYMTKAGLVLHQTHLNIY